MKNSLSPRVRILGIANIAAVFGLIFTAQVAHQATSFLGQATSVEGNISTNSNATAIGSDTSRLTNGNDGITTGSSYWYGRGDAWWGVSLASGKRIRGGEIVWYNNSRFHSAFIVEGSTDGTSWNELASVAKTTAQTQAWELNGHSDLYTFYRYRFIGNSNLSVIMEGRFFEAENVNTNCGNDVIDDNEQCDDGNQNSNDGCSSSCKIEQCGDGIVQTSEECDNGDSDNPNASASCNNDCTKPINISIGATAVASSAYQSPNNGNDDNIQNYWYDRGDTHWGITLSSPKRIAGGDIQWYSSAATYQSDFTVEGSTDGDTWTELGSFEESGDSIQQWKLSTPSNAYIHFRYHFTGNRGLTVLREARFFEAATDDNGLTGGTGGGPDPTCGNEVVETGEECDDGNTIDRAAGDTCTNTCKRVYCPDSIIQADRGEECDDGNYVDGDGCKNDCTLAPLCGDGTIDEDLGEECDDGNNNNTDDCTNECKEAACGDGFVQDNEVCDDGVDTGEGDPCPGLCQMKNICGNGVSEGQNYEQCDDGSENSDTAPDACRQDCISARCGDTVIDTGETCDDGNRSDGDGCEDCAIQPFCGDGVIDEDLGEQCDGGYACSSECEREPLCGDGIIDEDLGEECDDGNTVDRGAGDTCTSTCERIYCPDSIVQADRGEECDDGNYGDGDGCSSECTVEATCGNAVIETGEECDDGNQDNSDNCSNMCTNAFCGDGFAGTNIAAPVQPNIIKHLISSNLERSYKNVIVGDRLYATSRDTNSLSVIDISDPANARILGSVTDADALKQPQSIAVAGQYAYISIDNGRMAVVDISDDSEPTIVNDSAADSISLRFMTELRIKGDYLYATGNFYFYVFDISDPANPALLEDSTLNDQTLRGSENLIVQGNLAYVASKNGNFFIINIVNQDAPVIQGFIEGHAELAGASGLAVQEGYAYISARSSSALRVIDISDSSNPAIVAGVQDSDLIRGPSSLTVDGNYAYIIGSDDKYIRVIDIANPLNPAIVSAVEGTNNTTIPRFMSISGNYGYVSNATDRTLNVIDLGSYHGEISQAALEECDDGNTSDGDGCSNECTVEPLVKALNVLGVDDIQNPEPENTSQLLSQLLQAFTNALRNPSIFDFNGNGDANDDDDFATLRQALSLLLGINNQ